MANRNTAAISVGISLGILILITLSVFPMEQSSSAPMHIPCWDSFSDVSDARISSLEFKAILLRFAALVLDRGLVVLAIPVAILSGAVKLTELGRNSIIAKCIGLSCWLALASVVCAFFVGFCIPLGSICQNAEKALILAWWMGSFFAGLFVFVFYGPLFIILLGPVVLWTVSKVSAD